MSELNIKHIEYNVLEDDTFQSTTRNAWLALRQNFEIGLSGALNLLSKQHRLCKFLVYLL